MSVAILLRLVPGLRTGGRLAGHAEMVETGEVLPFRDVDEMVALLQRASLEAPPQGSVTEPASGLVVQDDEVSPEGSVTSTDSPAVSLSTAAAHEADTDW